MLQPPTTPSLLTALASYRLLLDETIQCGRLITDLMDWDSAPEEAAGIREAIEEDRERIAEMTGRLDRYREALASDDQPMPAES